MNASAVAQALRALADAIEAPAVPEEPFIFERPRWLEQKTWERALREVPTFPAGRRRLMKPADLIAWVEEQRVERDEPAPIESSEAISYERFAS